MASSSPAMETPPPTFDISWAQNLVGRDWEIFWEQGEDDKPDNDQKKKEQESSGTQAAAFEPVSLSIEPVPMHPEGVAVSTALKSVMMDVTGPQQSEDEEDSDDEDDPDVTDWYDGSIIGFDETGNFQVRFVGDDDTVYSMPLNPSIVRPCARAWAQRSRAILEQKSRDFDSWEKDLPADTATLQDTKFLEDKRDALEGTNANLSSSEIKERQNMYRLGNLVGDQIHLRSKLAPIVDSGHGSKTSGEPAVTDTYLNHLSKCLEEIVQLCKWYQSCWSVYEQLVGSLVPSSEVTVDYVNDWCLETGRERIVNVLAIDATRVGAKKRPVVLPATASSRQTKRRKVNKASPFLQSRQNFGEDGFLFSTEGMSLKSVKRFVEKVKQEEIQWFVQPCLRMLQRMCSKIKEPIRTWTRQAELILGEGSDTYDDSDESDQEMKESDARGSENGEDEDDASSSDHRRYYSYEEVEACRCAATNDAFLARINLSHWTTKLQQKLDGIVAFEIDGWRIMSHIYDEVGQCTKASDNVSAGLRKVQEAAQSTNAHVKNVDPLGRESPRLTRTIIEDAIAVREWILDLRHVGLARERIDFVLNVLSRAPTLPHVPPPPKGLLNDEPLTTSMSLSSRLEEAQGLSLSAFSHVHVYNRYERMVTNAESGDVDLCSIAGVKATLHELGATPVISVVEEKLSVRYDVLTWLSCARVALQNQDIEYNVVERLKNELDSITSGLSPSRSKRVNSLEKNVEIDNDIRRFAKNEVNQFCAQEAATVEQLYFKGRDWKERADSIILALRIHGNLAAGSSMNSNKTAAMVDLKRIDDLLAEYGALGSKTVHKLTVLTSVRDQAIKWSTEVEQIIVQNDNVLERLTLSRDKRPKGVLMDPARHVVDSWIEVLEWHDRVSVAFRELASSANSNATGPDSAAGDMFSTLIADKIHPLMMEGLEVVALFSRNRVAAGEFSLSPDNAAGTLSQMQESRKLQRTISIAKLEANHLGHLILSRIADNNGDVERGSPLFCLLFLCWRAAVITLIHRQSVTQEPPSSDEAIQRPTLEEAKALNALRPSLNLLDSQSETSNDRIAPFHILFSNMQTVEVAMFQELIADGERAEMATRMALSATKDVIHGSFSKTAEVRDHLAKLKLLQSDFKSRAQGHSGFTLSPALEQSLDSVVKDLSWLVRTFPYVALHSDEMPEQSKDLISNGRHDGSDDVSIPWDALVSLHERLPNPENDGPGGNIARVSLRVEELYEAAKAWQEEVTSHLPLSFRGSKRRAPGAQESDGDLTGTNMARLAQLAKHPILARVSMPRKTAVQQVLDRAREFEELLSTLLDTDFEGSSPDKAPYPDSISLVGRNGEFLLYRLTGSALYESLKTRLRTMSSAAEDVLADTPGKAAFEWIVKAVTWIDELTKSVSDASSKLVIPHADAMRILDHGTGLFLEITDELRKTLASHKIFLSTNKQTKRLTVVIGKGGAMHSLGGTAIKWCPLLFEWLKEDVFRQTQWDARAFEAVKAFQAMIAEYGNSTDDKESIYRWLHFREKFSLLLDEERDSLVITPRVVSSIATIAKSLDEWANKNMSNPTPRLDFKSLVKDRYEDGATALEDRFVVLGALLNRHELVADAAKRKNGATTKKRAGIPDGSTVRDKARSILDKSMRRGLQLMDIDEGNEASVYCAMKAWEIEEAMFGAFRQDTGTKSVTDKYKEVTDKYKEKLRSLRFNLEDTKNPTLCPRVLVGDIRVNRLLEMSSEEMAGKQVRQTRAKAEAEGKRNVILNPSVTKNEGRTTASLLKTALKNAGTPVNSPAERRALLNMPLSASSPRTARPVASIPPQPRSSPPGRQKTEEPSLFSSSPAATPSPRHGKASFKIGSLIPIMPPPPLTLPTPPSLAVATLPTPPSLAVAAAPMSPPQERTFALNASGGDSFSISVADSTRIFQVKLFLPDEASKDQVDRFLPELLTEKARVRIDIFSQFLKDKVRTGRWSAVPLRLSTVSEKSASEYKKFYKDYEKKERIAMFGKEYKIFLVTPKFHHAAKGLFFESPKSTYAVLLTKKRQFSG